MTKDGIEYDFNVTPYKAEKIYRGEMLTFYFSSELYKQKFTEFQTKFKIAKLEKIGLNFDFRMIQDLYNYCLIEKRGFRVDYGILVAGTLKMSQKRFNSIDEIKLESIIRR